MAEKRTQETSGRKAVRCRMSESWIKLWEDKIRYGERRARGGRKVGRNKNKTNTVNGEGRTRLERQGEGEGVSLLGRWQGCILICPATVCVCANSNLQGRAAAQNTLSISQ